MSRSTIYRRLRICRQQLALINAQLDRIDPERLNASDALNPLLLKRWRIQNAIWDLEALK